MGPTNVCPTSVERNKSDSLVLVKIFGFCSVLLFSPGDFLFLFGHSRG
jgi:hypothetical protein